MRLEGGVLSVVVCTSPSVVAGALGASAFRRRRVPRKGGCRPAGSLRRRDGASAGGVGVALPAFGRFGAGGERLGYYGSRAFIGHARGASCFRSLRFFGGGVLTRKMGVTPSVYCVGGTVAFGRGDVVLSVARKAAVGMLGTQWLPCVPWPGVCFGRGGFHAFFRYAWGTVPEFPSRRELGVATCNIFVSA